MNFLPFENLVFKSKLSAAQVQQRLAQAVEINNSFIFTRSPITSKPYKGVLSPGSFDIIRIISYRNSFLPAIKGDITDAADGAVISVKMRLHKAVMVFISGWLGIVGLAAIAMSVSMFSEGFNLEYLPFFLMFPFGLVLTIGAFKYESAKSKKDLQKILDAEIVS